MVTQMNLLFDPIVALNNQGCYLLGKGQRDEAMGQFKAALTYLRSTIHGNSDKNQMMMVDGGASLPSLLPLHLKEFHKLLLLSDNLDQPRNDSRDCTTGRWLFPSSNRNNNSPYVTFSLAIPILRGSNFSSEPADNEKVYTAVIVFNLAVTLHLKALESSSSGCIHQGLLKKAKSLYLHTYHLIVPILSAYLWTSQASENVPFDLLAMGLLNNLALIHLELFEYTECQCAFQRLLYYIKMVSSFRSPGRPAGSGREEDTHDDAHPSTQQHNHPDEAWLQEHQQPEQPQPRGSHSPPDGDEPFRRIHRMMDQVLADMLLNATYVQWNVMVAPAAAA